MRLEWELLERVYRPVMRRAARQILEGRARAPGRPEKGRWVRADVDAFLKTSWQRARELRPLAKLDEIPTLGNRHNLFLAIVTTAAYQSLLSQGATQHYAATLIGDVGWKVYRAMLDLASLPYRLWSRDPHQRMQRTLRSLLTFPFSAPGRPGYEVDVWSDGSTTHTDWTYCPPQAFVRRVIEAEGDRGELMAFYRSWCQYDWPGADVIAGDGARGHYRRLHTLSKGDAVCDMCWSGVPFESR